MNTGSGMNHPELYHIEETEGNHYETENDYIILVYFHGTTSRYERLIGYQIANSLNQDQN